MLALALAACGLALWRYPMARRADALVVAVTLVVEGLALATVTLLTPHLGTTSENALRAVSVGPLAIGLALLGGAMLVRRLPAALRSRCRDCAVGVLALSAVLTVGNTRRLWRDGRRARRRGLLARRLARALALGARAARRRRAARSGCRRRRHVRLRARDDRPASRLRVSEQSTAGGRSERPRSPRWPPSSPRSVRRSPIAARPSLRL